jgi:hypothetical protein
MLQLLIWFHLVSVVKAGWPEIDVIFYVPARTLVQIYKAVVEIQNRGRSTVLRYRYAATYVPGTASEYGIVYEERVNTYFKLCVLLRRSRTRVRH